jgi:hypothetical protein
MVVEMKPRSARKGLTKVCEPFFHFKNRPFQSYSPWSSASIDVKSGFSDPADLL